MNHHRSLDTSASPKKSIAEQNGLDTPASANDSVTGVDLAAADQRPTPSDIPIQPVVTPPQSLYQIDGLGRWNYYFLLKLFLFWRGTIGFHAVENLAFAAFLLIGFDSKLGRLFRFVSALIMAVALFYYDTWLPPISRLLSQVEVIQGFSFSYLSELFQRYLSIEFLAAIFLLWVVYLYVDRWLRTSVVVMTTLVILSYQTLAPSNEPAQIAIANSPTKAVVDRKAGGFSDAPGSSLDTSISQFFENERQRQVSFANAVADNKAFDILLLSVCSLAWDDLQYTGLDQHPLFSEFDIVMSNFNAVSSYSGPAVLRLLRANCGQSTHNALYQPAPQQCNLLDQLSQLGFERQLVMNHDGNFDNFASQISDTGHFDRQPVDMQTVKVAQKGFEDTAIYSDLDLLNHWLARRIADTSGNEKAVTLYNTISLHDGNRLVGEQANMNSFENFHPRMTTFLTDMSLFFERLAVSNRRVMVVLVPEHGAAARGDAMQAAAFREIPSPSIVNIPVAVKFFGPEFNQRNASTINVTQPVSHLAISHIIAKALEKDPFQGDFDFIQLLDQLPKSQFVAENDGTLVAKKGSEYFVKFKNADWIKYPTR